MIKPKIAGALLAGGLLITGCGPEQASSLASSEGDATASTVRTTKYETKTRGAEIEACKTAGTDIPATFSPTETGYAVTQDPNVLAAFNRSLAVEQLKTFDAVSGGNQSIDSLDKLTFIYDDTVEELLMETVGLEPIVELGQIACSTETPTQRTWLTKAGAAIRGLMISVQETKP